MAVVTYSVMVYMKVGASVSVALEAVGQASVTVLVLYTAAEGVYLQRSGACRFPDSTPVPCCFIVEYQNSKSLAETRTAVAAILE